jgi:hypothetical protein
MTLDDLKYFQDHGGIIISIVVVGLVIGISIILMHILNWKWWSKEFENVIKKSYDAVAQHEINLHLPEVLASATRDRRSRNNSEWTGKERRHE